MIYLEEVKKIFDISDYHHQFDFTSYSVIWEKRPKLVRKYAWSIITEFGAKEIVKFSSNVLLSIGCGTAYNESFISEYDTNKIIIPTDISPPKNKNNGYSHVDEYLNVLEYSAVDAINFYSQQYPIRDITLFLSWPSYNESWAFEALNLFQELGGEKVVYVGEGGGGCCADEDFHDLLENCWDKKYISNGVITYPGIHDNMYFYTRNHDE